MQRFGLAADMGHLRSFDKHEELRLELQSARLEEQPPGHAKVSLQQCLRMHKEFWSQVATQAGGRIAGVRIAPEGDIRPLAGSPSLRPVDSSSA